MIERVNTARTARDSTRKGKVLQQYSFFQLVIETMQESIRDYQNVVDSMKQELSLYEARQLRIRKKDGNYYFGSVDIETKAESSISGDLNCIHRLARRSFLESNIRMIEHRLKLLKQVTGNAEEIRNVIQMRKKLDKFASAGLDLSRILFTKEQNEWIDEPFTPNPYNRDSLTTQTSCGIWMRSKSEAIIGTSLEVIGLPYRSDDLVRIISDGKSGVPFRDTYFADFKVPNFLGGITVHEHFGAFQMENYGDNALQRLNDYHDFTVIEIEGRPVESNEFTWSFESDIRNAEGIKRLIRKLLLPL